eukprot:CAMPEP_0170511928 /NCGR_PEP_ID=MMETSP0208-20121228/66568_1 /TAXON_ID=197538 /ORGANISM="Strombidium inclinatum, Strain S3" /LENGTH=67 /DNA_ID=CAMNT_0010795507 /DNA_START=4007 /DNA_END=4210 /DNA_ORIENTATION=-
MSKGGYSVQEDYTAMGSGILPSKRIIKNSYFEGTNIKKKTKVTTDKKAPTDFSKTYNSAIVDMVKKS